MGPDLAMVRNGKKYMWDGQLYESQAEASRAADSYQENGFEVQIVTRDAQVLVYSRRSVGFAFVTAK
jgi:hypothetical protein